jgi:hypothetical protein
VYRVFCTTELESSQQIYRHTKRLLHVSAIFIHHQGGIQQIRDKTQFQLVMAWMLAFSFSLSNTPVTTAAKKARTIKRLAVCLHTFFN